MRMNPTQPSVKFSWRPTWPNSWEAVGSEGSLRLYTSARALACGKGGTSTKATNQNVACKDVTKNHQVHYTHIPAHPLPRRHPSANYRHNPGFPLRLCTVNKPVHDTQCPLQNLGIVLKRNQDFSVVLYKHIHKGKYVHMHMSKQRHMPCMALRQGPVLGTTPRIACLRFHACSWLYTCTSTCIYICIYVSMCIITIRMCTC
jgi:hypothetical protein